MQVDGFRWDIMGHLMLRNMKKVLEALSKLTVEKDGVDGSRIQQYAEAWSFGEASSCHSSSFSFSHAA